MTPLSSDPEDLFDTVRGRTIMDGAITDEGLRFTLDDGLVVLVEGVFTIYTGRPVGRSIN